MRPSRLLLVVLAISATLRSQKTAPDVVKADLDKLQGTWTAVEWVVEGDAMHPEVIALTKTTFRGHRYCFWQDTDRRRFDGAIGVFTLDPGRIPKTIDFHLTHPWAEDAPTTVLGIYELNGDRLLICTGDGVRRPTSFEAPHGSEFSLETCVRDRVEKYNPFPFRKE